MELTQFLKQELERTKYKGFFDEWDIDAELAVQVLTKIFQEMGIYRVPPSQFEILRASFIQQLSGSDEVKAASKKAKQIRAMASRTRMREEP